MADTQKSIQVTVGVTVSQAQQAMADLAKSTQDASTSMDNMGKTAASSSDAVSSSMVQASSSSHGFFSQMQSDIVSSLAAYDLFKKGLQEAIGFVQDSIGVSVEASATTAILQTNIKNAGLSYAELGPQIDAASQANIKLGFTAEDTQASFGRLILITKDYTTANQLNNLAMDLARSKGIDLASATSAIAQIMGGAGAKSLLQYGIYMKDGATTAEILNELQKDVAGSAENLAGTPAGAINEFNAQWTELQKTIGDDLMPTLLKLVDFANDQIPNIGKDFKIVGDALGGLIIGMVTYAGITYSGAIATGIMTAAQVANTLAVGDATAAMDLLNISMDANPVIILASAIAIASGLIINAFNGMRDAQEQADKAKSDDIATTQKLVDAYNAVHPAAQITISDLQGVTETASLTADQMALLKTAAKDYTDANSDQTKEFQAMTDAYNKQHPAALITIKDLEDAKDGSKLLTSAAKDYNDENTNTINVTDRAAASIAAQKKATDDAAAASKKATDEYQKNMQALTDAYTKVTQKSSEFSFGTTQDFNTFTTKLEDTKETQSQWVTEMEQGFGAMDTQIKTINTSIDSLETKLQSAEAAMQTFASSTGTSAGDQFAQIVHDAQQNLPKLQQQLADAQKSLTSDQSSGNSTTSDNSQIADLTKQITDAQNSIAQSMTSTYTNVTALTTAQMATMTTDQINAYNAQIAANVEFQAQLKLLNQQDSESQLQIAEGTLTKKVADKQTETNQLEAQINIQIADAQAEALALQNFQIATTKEFEENIKTRQKSQTDIEQPTLAATKLAVDALTTAYQQLAIAMSKTGIPLSQTSVPTTTVPIAGKKAKGGPVSAGKTYLVGEEGPELFTPGMVSGTITPNSAISSPQAGGQGTVININYPTVRNDSDINAITTAVIGALNRRDKLAKLGAYK